MKTRTLEDFLRKAAIDAWKNPTGNLTFHEPTESGFADGSIKFSGTFTYNGSFNDRHREGAGQIDKKNEEEVKQKAYFVNFWTEMLKDLGLDVTEDKGTYTGSTRTYTFNEEQVADILNQGKSVISPFQVKELERRRRHDNGGPDRKYRFNSWQIFDIGARAGLSDDQILGKIKSFYNRE